MKTLFCIFSISSSLALASVEVKIKLDADASKKLFTALNVDAVTESIPSEGGSHSKSVKTVPKTGIHCTHEVASDPFRGELDAHYCTIEAASK